MMGVPDVGLLSLGEWAAIVKGWSRAHGGGPEAPTDQEFDEIIGRVNSAARS